MNILRFTSIVHLKTRTSGPVENQRRALVAQHYTELDLFGAAVGHTHTAHLCLFSALFFNRCFSFCKYILFQL